MTLEIGYNDSFEVRREHYFSKCKDNFSILYLSDLHLNRFSKNMITKIEKTIAELNPTIVLLGGDYVDTKHGLIYLNYLLAALSFRKNVFAIAGNHDYFFGLNKIKTLMLNNNVIWIENDSFNFKINETSLQIDGIKVNSKKSIADFSILLLHKPINIRLFQKNYNIAFAGHLHGCQFVFWQSKDKLFPGFFFYKWNILKKKLNDCHYFISKGLGDTLPIRFNCKKDVLFVEIISKQHQNI